MGKTKMGDEFFADYQKESFDRYEKMTDSVISLYNETLHQLNNALLTASLAYMAIVVATIGDRTLSYCQAIEIGLSMVFIVISVVAGLVNYMLEIKASREVHEAYSDAATRIAKAKNITELSKAERNAGKVYRKYKDDKASLVCVFIQAIAFALGAISAMLLVFSFL